jgi:hypothetical protein
MSDLLPKKERVARGDGLCCSSTTRTFQQVYRKTKLDGQFFFSSPLASLRINSHFDVAQLLVLRADEIWW